MAVKKLERVTTPKPLKWFANREEIIRFDLYVQRNEVWNSYQKSLLIHSILYGYPVPPLYSCDKGDGLYWVLDGKQRLTSIIDYLQGRFSLSEDIPDVFGEEIAGKYFSELSEEMQKDLRDQNLMVFHYKNITAAEIEELFYRLNNGTPLSKIESTRARSGELIKKVDELLEGDLYGSYLQMGQQSRNRFKDAETVFQTMMVLEGLEHYKNIGSVEITKFVKNKRENGINELYKEMIEVVNYVEESLEGSLKKELKLFKKTNVPVIVKVANEMRKEGMNVEDFKRGLVEFFIDGYDKDGEYALLVKSGTSNRENVLRRVNLLRSYMRKIAKRNCVAV